MCPNNGGQNQKSKGGKWKDGFAPYGYQIANVKVETNIEEAVAIHAVYDQYVNMGIDSNGISKYLKNHGIDKVQFKIGKTSFLTPFSSLDIEKIHLLR